MNRPETKLKDKAWEEYINHIEAKLLELTKSPHTKHYLTILGQINDWSDQLQIREEDMVIDGVTTRVMRGRIEMFGSKDDKEFDRATKYFKEIDDYLTKLDNLRAKMSVEDREELAKKEQLDKTGHAEKLLMKSLGK